MPSPSGSPALASVTGAAGPSGPSSSGGGCPAPTSARVGPGVPLGVDAGREGRARCVVGQLVESAQQFGRFHVEPRQRAHRRAQLDHGHCGLGAVAHRVADDQADPAAGARQDVEPVAADDVGLPGREITVRDTAAVEGAGRVREQAVADGERGAALALVAARVVQGHTRPRRQRLHGDGLAGQERLPVRAARARDEPDGGTPQLERNDEERRRPEQIVYALRVTARGGQQPIRGVLVHRVEQLRVPAGQSARVRGLAREHDHLADRQHTVPGLRRLRAHPQRQPPRLDLGRIGGGIRVLLQHPPLQQIHRRGVAEPGRQRVHDMAAGQPQIELGADHVRGGREGGLPAAWGTGRECVTVVTARFVPQGRAFQRGGPAAWRGGGKRSAVVSSATI